MNIKDNLISLGENIMLGSLGIRRIERVWKSKKILDKNKRNYMKLKPHLEREKRFLLNPDSGKPLKDRLELFKKRKFMKQRGLEGAFNNYLEKLRKTNY